MATRDRGCSQFTDHGMIVILLWSVFVTCLLFQLFANITTSNIRSGLFAILKFTLIDTGLILLLSQDNLGFHFFIRVDGMAVRVLLG